MISRRFVAVALILLFPLVQAQEVGDHEFTTGPYVDEPAWHPASTLGGSYDDLDLVEVLFGDTPDAITITILVADPSADGGDRPSLIQSIITTFSLLGFDFELYLGDPDAQVSGTPQTDQAVAQVAHLFLLQGTGRLEIEGMLGVDEVAQGWSVSIPRGLLEEITKQPIVVGSVVEKIQSRSYAESRTVFTGCFGPEPTLNTGWCGIAVRDFLPNQGFAEDYSVTTEPRGDGPIAIRATNPIRASNGEATTYLYELLVTNSHDKPLAVVWSARDIPRGWTVVLPRALTIGPGEGIVLGAAASIPFAHQHGGTETYHLVGKADDQEYATELGVRFLLVPQPAGHHDTLYLHAPPDGNQLMAWMDTLTDPASVTGAETGPKLIVEGAACLGGCPEEVGGYGYGSYARLAVPLKPPLEIGIDARIDELAILTLPFTTDESWQNVHMQAYLDLQQNDLQVHEPLRLFAGEIRGVNFAPGEMEVEIPLHATPEADYVEVPRSANLTLMLWASVEGPVDTPSNPLPSSVMEIRATGTDGARIWLPLTDFHHRLTEGAGKLLTIRPLNPTPIEITPTTPVEIEVRGPIDEIVSIQATVSGATVSAPAQARLDGGVATVAISVTGVPAGEHILVVQAVGASDPSLQGLALIPIHAAEDIPGATPKAEATAISPAILVVGLLVLGAGGRGRRPLDPACKP